MQHLPIYLFSWQLYVTQQHNELLRFNCNSGYANAPLCYVVRTLPTLFKFDFVSSLFCVFSLVVCCFCTRLVFLRCLYKSIYGCCASALIRNNWTELLTYTISNFVFINFFCHTQNFYHRYVNNCWLINSVLYKILGCIYDLCPYELLHIWLQCCISYCYQARS